MEGRCRTLTNQSVFSLKHKLDCPFSKAPVAKLNVVMNAECKCQKSFDLTKLKLTQTTVFFKTCSQMFCADSQMCPIEWPTRAGFK